MRLIDADKLKEKKRIFHTDEYGDWCVTIEDIDNSPTVDTVKHGRWSTKTKSVLKRNSYTFTEYTLFICSVCGSSESKDTDFCPHCGAFMDLEGDD